MPFIHISTSKKIEDADQEKLMKEFGKEISILKGKTEKWLMVKISDEQAMCFQGDSKTPCVMIEVSIYGRFQNQEYQKLTEALTDTVLRITEIPAERIFVKYIETDHWGWNSSNF